MQKFEHNIGVFERKKNFADNCQKPQKIVIITSPCTYNGFSSFRSQIEYTCVKILAF
jgi:hypothetical protein